MFGESVKCRTWGLAAVITLSALALPGCSKKHAAAHEGPIALGSYRATLKLPGGELPFGLEIVRENNQYVAYLVNGAERVRVPEVTVADGRIDMKMPGYENTLTAKIDDDELEGTVTLIKRDQKNQVIPFAAEFGVDYRFVEEPLTDNADLAGRWAVTFTPDDGSKPYAAVGEFSQSHSEVTGTFLTGTGDHRFLAGDVRDDEFFLSTFDGAHAYLYKGKIDGKGNVSGTYWSGLASREKFAGKRADGATLGDAESVTKLRDDADGLDFTFPDLDGNPVSSRDPRFAGKVVIVTLGGSWCPNCHDEAAFLGPYYVQNRERGLEVVELMFEHFGDFPQAAAATKRFRDAFNLQYTMLIAGTSDKDQASQKLPQLNRVFAFPTTVFLDRKGRVRRIYTGFSGPGTGEHYQKLIDDFAATVEQLLAETDENTSSSDGT
jgi:thiol-disulfide isomerase/thioredoxin